MSIHSTWQCHLDHLDFTYACQCILYVGLDTGWAGHVLVYFFSKEGLLGFFSLNCLACYTYALPYIAVYYPCLIIIHLIAGNKLSQGCSIHRQVVFNKCYVNIYVTLRNH